MKHQLPHNIKVIWEPIPNSSQVLALTSPCDITLYTGSRGPGKSDCQLMYFRQYVGQGYGPFWRGVIFDRHYKNLDDLVSKSKRWFPEFADGAQFKEAKSDYKWVWPTGEELLFRSAEAVSDYYDYHGQEFPFIGWNELTNYQTLELFDMMMSCNRSSYVPSKNGFAHSKKRITIIDGEETREVPVNPWTGELPPPIPLRVFATTNPFGAGHHAVKQRFIDVAPYGKIVETITRLYNPQTKQDEDVRRTQVALFGSWRENPYLDPKYIAVLKNVTDPNMRRAWDQGDWNIVAGGPLDDVWDNRVHIVPVFAVPASWRLFRAFDWGSTHPFSYGLWAEANGEEAVMPDGSLWAPPAGSLIQVDEIYGAEALGVNKGLRWPASVIAETIIAREQMLHYSGAIRGEVEPGPADNQIRNVGNSENKTIEEYMNEKGCYWTLSDKSPGSRVNGLEMIRQRLYNAKHREGAGLYFMQRCVASYTTIPLVPRDEKKINDTDTNAEDHALDMTRYACLDNPVTVATDISVTMGRSR